MVVDQSNHTAHQPASRITHGDRKDGVGDEVRCDVQIDLTEYHKGKEHDVHRDLTLARPPKGAGIDLIDTTQHIAGTQGPQEEGAVRDHFRLIVEKGHQSGRGAERHNREGYGDAQRETKGGPGALLGPVQLAGAQILAHKGGGGQGQGLHGQEHDLIDLRISGPAGHAVSLEEVDIGLNEYVGKGGYGHLQSSGDADAGNLLQNEGGSPQGPPVQLDAGAGADQEQQSEQGGNALGDNGGVGHALYSHMEHNDQQ